MAGPTGNFYNDDNSVCIKIKSANESTGRLSGTLEENGYAYPVVGGYSHEEDGLTTRVNFSTENSGEKDDWAGAIDRWNNFQNLRVIRTHTYPDGLMRSVGYELKRR
ncbi:hypothetical protein ACKUG4_19815 [Pseudomonas glycinae]|jgi:hypothetical protein|uniref:hypothetical protein n=1 Tax=Candidatus Pseudomonas auctus TaxID=3461260 RepID=UPI003B920367